MASSFGETWGLSVNEAMNFKLPIVVSNLTGSSSDLVCSNKNGYTFELDQAAKDFIIEHGYDEKYGARPIKRMVQNHIEDLLAELWIDGKLRDNGHVKITVSKDSNGLTESSIEDRSR